MDETDIPESESESQPNQNIGNNNLELKVKIYLNSYNKIRDEILAGQQNQIQSLEIVTGAIILLLGYIFVSKAYILTALIPILILLNSHIFLHSTNQVLNCGLHNIEIEKMINRLLQQEIMFWELKYGGLTRKFFNKNRISSWIFTFLTISLFLIFSAIGVIYFLDFYGVLWAILLSIFYTILFVQEAIFYFSVVEVRESYRKERPSEK